MRLAAGAEPAVSLIVVVYGGYPLARRTLAAIAATADVDYEVIVVDNASPDGTGSRLRDETDGARFILNDRNLGFGAAINLGVLHAQAPLVGLMNADIEPNDGFLSPLVAALAEDPRAAAVTPMYLAEGGRIVEAGGLLGADGRGYGHGVGWEPNHPGVAFRREVDYGSAAALVVRRDRFDQVGGLDPVYGMGYYEDADLCFAFRDAGFVTLYEPRSQVRHLEHGSFDRAGRIDQLARNRPLFAARYHAQLAGRPLLRRPPFDPHADLVVRDWWAPQRLLVIDPRGVLEDFASSAQRSVAPRPCHGGRGCGPAEGRPSRRAGTPGARAPGLGGMAAATALPLQRRGDDRRRCRPCPRRTGPHPTPGAARGRGESSARLGSGSRRPAGRPGPARLPGASRLVGPIVRSLSVR